MWGPGPLIKFLSAKPLRDIREMRLLVNHGPPSDHSQTSMIDIPLDSRYTPLAPPDCGTVLHENEKVMGRAGVHERSGVFVRRDPDP